VVLADHIVHPAETVLCALIFPFPEYHVHWLTKGARFELLDGDRVRATGVIESVEVAFNEDISRGDSDSSPVHG
jgi:hypothetical protein